MSHIRNQTVAVSGATGLIGQQLASRLEASGAVVVPISRRSVAGRSIVWDPDTGVKNPELLNSVDAVVHLAGENIAGKRWNTAVKERIRRSRVDGTRSLVQSLREQDQRPRTLICASAIGYYGSRGDEILTEDSAAGTGFLADVCRAWEAEAMAAEEFGVRVICLRIGVVLSPRGGALAKMLLPFRMGVGGIVGNGRQYWSWIGLNDLVRALEFCLQTESLRGPVNAVSPETLTNAEFTRCLAGVLHRPAIFPMPAFAAKLALGEMADELLLSSIRVVPDRLLQHEFKFEQPDLTSCLKYELFRQ